MLACIVGLLPSLLYLAPVLAMVAFVVYAKLRGPLPEELDGDLEPDPAHDHELVT
jgi:hypothetical protein